LNGRYINIHAHWWINIFILVKWCSSKGRHTTS